MSILNTALFKGFTFGGVSSLAYDIYITGEGVYDAPERAVEKIAVPGRNGEIIMDGGRFENVPVTYAAKCFAKTQAEFASKVSAFRNAICSKIGYQRLTDTYNTSEYRMAAYVSGLSVDPVVMSRAGEFEITFDAMPQRWLTSGEAKQSWTTTTKTLTNPTQFDAKPLIEVTGHGVLTIGSQSITINGTSSTQVIYIDCDTMEAWEMSGSAMVPRNDYIQNAGDDFPVLVPGANSIRRGTGISAVAMTPRWWRV